MDSTGEGGHFELFFHSPWRSLIASTHCCPEMTSEDLYVCMYVYFGTCLTMQNSETVNNGSEKEGM